MSKHDSVDHLHLPLDQLPATINRLFLAFSGGIDSVVLLHNLLEYRNQYQIILWHINHGLQPNAGDMEQLARSLAQQFNLESRYDQLSLDPDEGNLEATARQQRYSLFSAELESTDVLLTAHHMNDQAETIMLNLMRGSGPGGLSAIAAQRPLGKGILYRPLLNVSRSEIEKYATEHQLNWVEDPSNQSLGFNRNYIRHQVLPTLVNRWPSAISQLHRVSEWQNESNELINELAIIDFEHAAEERPFSAYICLSIDSLLPLTDARKKNLIRFWLKHQAKPVTGYKKMAELLSQLNARRDAMPQIEADGFCIRFYRHCLYIVDDRPQPDLNAVYEMPVEGELVIASIKFKQSRDSLIHYLQQEEAGQKVSLHFRQQNKTLQPGSHAHKLKRLFHQYQVPPWKRTSIPQIFINDELAGLWLL